MKKYQAIKTDNHAPFCQIVTIQNNVGETRVITLGQSIAAVPVGTTFKVYETMNKEPFPLEIAHSYKIDGKRFVNIPHQPTTMDGIKRFWTQLGFWDGVRLQLDIGQALHRQKIVPAFNKNTNLYLLLGNTVVR
ncbi:MAG: hypothetical protein IKW57_00070 [Alphaproteobacteria bacterium]|nr:hypothetical protein [Alphaproteobacteria bacterium]